MRTLRAYTVANGYASLHRFSMGFRRVSYLRLSASVHSSRYIRSREIMATKKTSVPGDKLRLYERLIDTLDGIDTKSNFGSAYTVVNGNMYSMISKHGVVGIRLPSAEREAFLERYSTELFRGDPSWPPAKEYVAVPDELLE